MGVMQCDRSECGNILCETRIDGKYICNECKTEFEAWMRDEELYARDMVIKFREFMATDKPSQAFNGRKITVREFLGLDKETDD